jgi:hypothetical protein
MTIAAAKKKLHDYIDHADEQKVMELLSIVQGQSGSTHVYDEQTLNMLRQRSKDYRTGKVPTFPMEESMERIKQQRKKNGL